MEYLVYIHDNVHIFYITSTKRTPSIRIIDWL